MVPCIICEAKEEEDMIANLRADFKERQCKHLSESIAVAPFLAQKSYGKVLRVAPVLNVPSPPRPSADAIGSSRVLTVRAPVGKDARVE